MEKRTYNIDGMTCGGCTSALEKKLLEDPGIETASASHENNSCEVTFDPAKMSVMSASRKSPIKPGLNLKARLDKPLRVLPSPGRHLCRMALGTSPQTPISKGDEKG